MSWLALRGRCRTCGARVPAQSTLIELATAVLFAAMAWRFGWHWELGGYLVLVAALVPLTVIDLHTQTLPRGSSTPAPPSACRSWSPARWSRDEPVRLQWALLGGLGGLGFFLLLYLGWKGGMGDGDVRLAALLGIFLGWIGPMHVPVGLFLGFVAGAVVGIAMLARGAGRKTEVPFGPFMALGAVIVILWGHPIIDLWLPD